MQNRQTPSSPPFEAALLGVPIFLRHGQPVAIAERKTRALLAFLATSPGLPHARDRLVSLFWPLSAGNGGRASLRQALSAIRLALKDQASLIRADRDTVLLDPGGCFSDVAMLETLAADASSQGQVVPEMRGPFLEGLSGFSAEFDNWRAVEEARLTALASTLHRRLARVAEADGQPGAAALHLTRALALEPMDEDLTRRAMQFHARQGNSAKALEQFRQLQTRMEAELGVPPERATLDLAREIRAGRLRPLPPAGPAPPSLPFEKPKTRYARAGAINIAYQVSGAGPIDLVYVPGWISNLDLAWEHPVYANFLHGLGSIARVIRFDKRGTGLSDRNVGYPTLEQRMEDVRAVMDAAGVRQAVLFGTSEGGNLCMQFAATHPERTRALVLYGAFARGLWAPDYPWAKTQAQVEEELSAIARDWGGAFDFQNGAPSLAADPAVCAWFAAFLRQSASPQDALALWRWNTEIDMRATLPAIRVPTLVLHRSGDRWVKAEEGRYLAERIANAVHVEFPGDDHILWAGDIESVLTCIASHLARWETHSVSTILATLLALQIRPARPAADPERLRQLALSEMAACEGQLRATGEGLFVASFPGPSQAIRCAAALAQKIAEAGGTLGAAVHVGECRLIDHGLQDGETLSAVRAAATQAAPGEVLVTAAVRHLLTGAPVILTEERTIRVPGLAQGITGFRAILPDVT